MNGQPPRDASLIGQKISRLVAERGWTQEEFARRAGVNRHTARQILLHGDTRRLRNATIKACAKALGLTVNDLQTLPLEALLQKGPEKIDGSGSKSLHRAYEESCQPELSAWLEQNADRAERLTDAEMDELLSLQGTGGPLTSQGIDHFVDIIERRRQLVEYVEAIAGTEYLDLLEMYVMLLYQKIVPYGDRK